MSFIKNLGDATKIATGDLATLNIPARVNSLEQATTGLIGRVSDVEANFASLAGLPNEIENIRFSIGDLGTALTEIEKDLNDKVTDVRNEALGNVSKLHELVSKNAFDVSLLSETVLQKAGIADVKQSLTELALRIPTLDDVREKAEEVVPDVLLDLPSIGASIPLLSAISRS